MCHTHPPDFSVSHTVWCVLHYMWGTVEEKWMWLFNLAHTSTHLAGLRWETTQHGQAALTEANRWLTQWSERQTRCTGDG